MAVHPDVFQGDAVSQAKLNQVGSRHGIAVLIGRHRPTVQVVDPKTVIPEAHPVLPQVIRDQSIGGPVRTVVGWGAHPRDSIEILSQQIQA